MELPAANTWRTNISKMGDAARTIRHYVAALLPTNSGNFFGFFQGRLKSEIGGCDGCRVELGPI